MKKLLAYVIACYCLTAAACLAGDSNPPPKPEAPAKALGLSVETFGALRSHDITGPSSWGAGVGVGYKFNAWVTGRVRAISYSDDNWRGGVVDEGSLLVEATLLKSANGGVTLSAVGGADRDFNAEDWGFSVGIRPAINLTKNLSIFGESRIRAWFDQGKDLITTAGLQLSF